jgi:HSP20 family protein
MLPVLRTRVPFGYGANLAWNGRESLFDRFFGEDGESVTRSGSTRPVPLTMWQDDEHLYIEADLPGLAENDVEITIHKGVLSLKAERQAEDNRNYVYNSRWHGTFEQNIMLPETVDADHVDAALTGGVLKITLTKHAEAKPKKVSLRTA